MQRSSLDLTVKVLLLEQVLHQKIEDYFTGKLVRNEEDEKDKIEAQFAKEKHLKADIKVFLSRYASQMLHLNGRSVARIFHGIPSPSFPTSEWSRNTWWSRYRHLHFNSLKSLITQQILLFKSQQNE